MGDPPNLSRIGVVSQKDKDRTLSTFQDLEWLPKGTRMGTPEPFTIWRLFPSKRLTADFLLPNSAYKMCHIRWAVGRSRTPRQQSFTESSIQTQREPIYIAVCLITIPASTPSHRKPTASSGTRQDSLTESPHEDPPAQHHRKPNPERDRFTECPHALLLVS